MEWKTTQPACIFHFVGALKLIGSMLNKNLLLNLDSVQSTSSNNMDHELIREVI